MTEEMHAHDPVEGEYTDAELPLDARVPKEQTRGEADWVDGDGDDDEVVIEEVDVEVIEFVDPDRTDRTQL